MFQPCFEWAHFEGSRYFSEHKAHQQFSELFSCIRRTGIQGALFKLITSKCTLWSDKYGMCGQGHTWFVQYFLYPCTCIKMSNQGRFFVKSVHENCIPCVIRTFFFVILYFQKVGINTNIFTSDILKYHPFLLPFFFFVSYAL